MMDDGIAQTRGGFWSSVASLLATSSTLVCCAIPVALVAVGAGAVLSSLISVFPQVVWLSEHKEALFALSGLALTLSGWMQWRNRRAPCPVDPRLRNACLRTRKASLRVYLASLAFFTVGGFFAFIAPLLG
jgi:hypothetical protein